jgi:hypothetical protein
VRALLAGEEWVSSRLVVADSFRMSPVSPGRYELRITSWGQRPRVDSIDVPSEGLALIVPFERTDALDGCSGPIVVTSRKKPWWKFW